MNPRIVILVLLALGASVVATTPSAAAVPQGCPPPPPPEDGEPGDLYPCDLVAPCDPELKEKLLGLPFRVLACL